VQFGAGLKLVYLTTPVAFATLTDRQGRPITVDFLNGRYALSVRADHLEDQLSQLIDTMKDVAESAANLPTTATPGPATVTPVMLTQAAKRKVITVTFDGLGDAVTVNSYADWRAPWDYTIKKNSLLADQASESTIGVWKDTYAAFPPTVADSVVGGGTKPTLTGGVRKSEDATLSGWAVSGLAGDVLRFNVDTNSVATRLELSLEVEPS
jgi:hypothetical protein